MPLFLKHFNGWHQNVKLNIYLKKIKNVYSYVTTSKKTKHIKKQELKTTLQKKTRIKKIERGGKRDRGPYHANRFGGKKIPSSSAPSLSPKSSVCFFERGPRIESGEMEGEKKDNSRINNTEGEKMNVNTKILKDVTKKWGTGYITLSILRKKKNLSPKYLIDLIFKHIQHKNILQFE